MKLISSDKLIDAIDRELESAEDVRGWIEQTSGDSVQYGWVCPKCGRVYSPSTSNCFYCGDKVYIDCKTEEVSFATTSVGTQSTYSTTTASCGTCDVPHNKWTGCPNLDGLIPPPDYSCSHYENG